MAVAACLNKCPAERTCSNESRTRKRVVVVVLIGASRVSVRTRAVAVLVASTWQRRIYGGQRGDDAGELLEMHSGRDVAVERLSPQ